jgi:hypothetical protein
MRASRTFVERYCTGAAAQKLVLIAAGGILMLAVATDASAADMALASRIPLPDRSLLEPPAEPDCKFKDAVSNPVTAEQLRMKLDYEQQCYRQAEEIVRTRLRQLQDSVSKTIRAVERRNR